MSHHALSIPLYEPSLNCRFSSGVKTDFSTRHNLDTGAEGRHAFRRCQTRFDSSWPRVGPAAPACEGMGVPHPSSKRSIHAGPDLGKRVLRLRSKKSPGFFLKNVSVVLWPSRRRMTTTSIGCEIRLPTDRSLLCWRLGHLSFRWNTLFSAPPTTVSGASC